MNLLIDPWLPTRLRDGTRALISTAEIVRKDVVALDFPRLDFNGVIAEFLIGVLSTTYAPQDEKTWTKLWHARPTVDDLKEAFAPIAPAFEAEVFMQRTLTRVVDSKDGVQERTSDRLLIDNLSGSTADEGRDMLNRAKRIESMGLSSAMAALITLQMHANQGGSGAYQCVRGGGCMSTLVRYGDDLWGLVWPNVETKIQIRDRSLGAIPDSPYAPFPWMWDMPDDLGPDNMHPCVIYWATPRRLKLNITKSNDARCSLSGELATEVVKSFSYLSGGPKFMGWQGHPLSAVERKPKKDRVATITVVSPVERIGMQHWLGLVQESDGTTSPAACVANARLHRRGVSKHTRLVVHGYAAKAATVVAWTAAEMPLVLVERDDVNDDLRDLAAKMVGATEHAAKALQTAVNVAQNLRSAKDRRKKYIRALSKSAYGMVWRAVEREFFSALAEVPSLWSDDSDDPTRTIRERFYVHLRRATYSALNATCPDENLSPRDVTNAHQQLRRALQSKGMAKVLSLPTGRAA